MLFAEDVINYPGEIYNRSLLNAGDGDHSPLLASGGRLSSPGEALLVIALVADLEVLALVGLIGGSDGHNVRSSRINRGEDNLPGATANHGCGGALGGSKVGVTVALANADNRGHTGSNASGSINGPESPAAL